MSRTGWLALAALVVATIGLGETGCLITYDADGVELLQPTDTTSPNFIVLAPTPNTTVGETLTVQVQTINFSLVAHWGQPNVNGEAHLYVTVDGEPIPTADTATGRAAGEMELSQFGFSTAEYAAGTHELEIEVRNNDRTRFSQDLDGDGTASILQPVIVQFTK